VADDHEVVTRGVSSILSARKDVEVIDDAQDGRKAIEKAREANPDLIILDITMPVLDGFSAAKEIREFLPKVPILFLSMHEGRHIEEQAKSVGAQGFVRKAEAGADLLNAVDCVLRNETFFRT